MQIIAMLGQKGGGGKTTIGTGLAVEAAARGKATLVIDLDPQANAANWRDRRAEDNPAVVAAPPSRLRPTIEAARNNGAEFVFIDTPAKNSEAGTEAARYADLVLIPVWPQIYHLETLTAMRDILRIGGDPCAFVVLNGVHPQATTKADEVKAMIADIYGLTVAPVHLCDRAIYAEAPATGCSAQEIDRDGKAAAELERLFSFILENLKGATHGKKQQLKKSASGG